MRIFRKTLQCAALLAGFCASEAEAKTGYLGLPPAAFVPALAEQLSGSLANNGCFYAPVQLPQGAKITAIAVWYNAKKQDAIRVVLHSLQYMPDGDIRQLVTLTSTNTSNNYAQMVKQLSGPRVVTVDNERFAYVLSVCPSDAKSAYYAGRITYTYND
jgi:hypothetical protein